MPEKVICIICGVNETTNLDSIYRCLQNGIHFRGSSRGGYPLFYILCHGDGVNKENI